MRHSSRIQITALALGSLLLAGCASTGNPDTARDQALFARLGLEPEPA